MTRVVISTALPLGLLLLLSACQSNTALEQVLANARLVVVTANGPTSYYEGRDGPTGFEYDLAAMFAAELGVELEVVAMPTFGDVLPEVVAGRADFAAAGITVTEGRKAFVRFSVAYQKTEQVVVYHNDTPRPEKIADLIGSNLEVIANTSYVSQLRKLRGIYPELAWREVSGVGIERLLERVNNGLVDYTVVDSNVFTLNRWLFPETRIAFSLSAEQPQAWAFPRGGDSSLYEAANEFLERVMDDGRLSELIVRHYSHLEEFDYVGTRLFLQHIQQRLPPLRPFMETAAGDTGLDWRLIAAIGYQESHWNPEAISPTGVRGVMMLTQPTASHVGVVDRLDPQQSIFGGARYFWELHTRLPDRILEPDRTWLALAAYNVGYGHLEDARVLTARAGGNPDRWADVKRHLPLLTQEHWYNQTRHGYARGHEPVRYVENIRSYFDILVWFTDRQTPPQVANGSPESPAAAPQRI